MSSAKIAIILYSTYGHVAKLSESVIAGVKAANVEYKVFQITETLPDEVLQKMYANKEPIKNYPEVTPDDLKQFDGFIFGFPTRYGRAPAQVSAFFDRTGGLWASGALVGKFATIFTSTASQHGGLETTALTTLPFFVHHGIIFVPYGYQHSEAQQNVDKIVGSSAYGAGTVAGGQGQLQPDPLDLSVAEKQGEYFAKVVSTYVKGSSA
ncbi:putative 1,4-benzoquinone reductase [Meira miltonrushii]|uniref:Putative 1,4-benzoquinone reductase n=1 Tax=Meira miltonrushii TaxID=1280837 RepID=A0A316V6C2_9BASI|nr:putative 1,4-benzoquinone reductase [Meira miltonrushii]PWN33127.1 putative 1,4-benzoquinone reductase [Meira miltonrushii]